MAKATKATKAKAKKPKQTQLFLVKLGSDARPATDQDIKDVEKQMKEVIPDNIIVIVSHHSISIDSLHIEQ